MTQWTLQPILDSYAAVALLALLMAAMLLVGPAFRRQTARRRWILLGIRGGVILLVLLAMLRPTRVSTSSRPQSAAMLVLFDLSRSMQLPHSSGELSRWQAQQEALQRIRSELNDLAQEIDIKVFGYDDQLHPIDLDQGQIAFPEEPRGDQTDIGSTLDEAVQRELGERLVAVVLLGDGAQTAFAPRVEVQEAGRTLARLEYPLFTVAFGPPGDVAQSRDVAIENLPEQYMVFVKNELPVKGMLRVRGYVNQEIPVELIVENAAGESTTVGTVRPLARQDGEQISLEIPYTPSEPGQYKLTLRTAVQPGELVTRNNELSAFLTVLEGGLRVLYLYGDLLGEQRILRRSINASPDIQLDDLFLDPKNLGGRTADLGDLLTGQQFDALLIESVDSDILGGASLQAIEQAVEQGKGLMMIGGYNSFGPGGYFGTPLALVLPIAMGRFERQGTGYDEPISRDLHLWGRLQMLPVPDRDDPLMRLGAESENAEVWRSLPKLDGANRFGLKPRSQVLAETPSREPLLVAGEYGQGRVLAFAGNSTYRWWQYGRQAEHRRFWRQAILWLVRRDDTQQNDVWIKLTQRRYNPGARVTFEAGVRSAAGDVIADASFTAMLVAPDGGQRAVRLVADKDQVTGTLEEITQPGDYLVEVEASRAGQPLGKARADFQVLDRDVELGSPAANYGLMTRLAALTKDAGGRLVAPERLPQLLEEIKQRRPEMQIDVQSKWQLADTPQDAWLFFLILLGLFAMEWTLRKKWGLV